MADNQNENNNYEQIIEAILFAAGRVVAEQELMIALEMSQEKIENIINKMQIRYEKSGIQIIKVEKGYQMCSNPKYYEYIYPIIDKRTKPNLSNAALETLAIIAYNPRATRPEIEAIRGVNSDGTIYKLLEYGLIEEAGKADLPGRPTTYKTTQEFLKMFGYTDLNKLPELPRYKLDENQQIVIDDIIEEKEKDMEAPSPEREEEQEEKVEIDGKEE